MNPINEIFENLSNQELAQAIEEIKQCENSGYIEDGIVKQTARKCSEILELSSLGLLDFTMNQIKKEAAYRWLGMYQNQE